MRLGLLDKKLKHFIRKFGEDEVVEIQYLTNRWYEITRYGPQRIEEYDIADYYTRETHPELYL